MKIYVIPIEEKFRPKRQDFKYPIHNKDYGVEQDFYKYIKNNQNIIVDNPNEADWHYLPIFWTRWHLNHNYGKDGLDELQKEVRLKIINDAKTFTICQYDDGPIVDTGKSIQFLASRKGEQGIDIPLLSDDHRKPLFKIKKKFLATFSGTIQNHIIREKMQEKLKNLKDISIENKNGGASYFVKRILSSYISLSPRGYGGSSFRFFESMQLGVVPLLLGEPDTRPFKKFINWDTISLYAKNIDNIKEIILSKTKEELITMGKKAKEVYHNKLTYQKWCVYVIKELEKIKNEK
jgi:hypothetical protein